MGSMGKLLDGKYKMIKILGKGGMGTVYLCENVNVNKLWAIKEIKKDINNRMDFLSEPNILKNINHPGIPKIIDIFYEEDKLYIVEDYIEGKTLKEYVREGNICDEEDMYKIMLGICGIIEYLHGLNPPIIYRDLKPSNIIITKEKKVVLVDFGIAKQYKLDNNDETIKVGSNGYAAPEQYGSGNFCNRTDIYGAGMVLYFMASGNNPSTPIEPLIDGNYKDNLSDDIKRIIQKCVQIEINDRYDTIEALKKDINEVVEKNIYEDTLFLDMVDNSLAIKPKIPKLKRYLIGFIALIVIAFTILYFWEDYRGKSKEDALVQKSVVNASTETLPKLEDIGENTVDNDTVKEDKEKQDNSNITSQGKGKGKGQDKKRNKNKH